MSLSGVQRAIDVSLFDDGLLTIQQASKFLGLSRAGIYSLMKNDHLLYVMVGSVRRIPKRALFEYLESGIRGDRAKK